MNYWSVKFFGKTNTIITIFKFIVPILIVIVMFANMDFTNFNVGGAEPGGIHGVFQAVVGAGVAFAFLGFRQAVDFAGEARNPQRNLPIAILLSITLCLGLYVLLQIAFIGAVPAEMLNQGWATINWESPWAQLAQTLGIIWLANLVLFDAVVSPAACGNAYFSGTARMMFAWAKNGYFYSIFAKVDKRTGLPRGALWLSMIMGIAWTLPEQFQTWGGLIGAVSSALILTYLTGPVSAGALRKRSPNLKRPFYLKGMGLIAPLSFASASLVAYWSGFDTLILLIGLTIGSLVLFFAFADNDEKIQKNLKEDFRSSLWLLVYFVFLLVISYVGSFGPANSEGEKTHQLITGPWDSIILAIGSIIIYYFGVKTSLKTPRITKDEEEQE
nr:APC family permease [Virgibacillus ihumii]